MRALIILTVWLLNPFVMAQDQTQAVTETQEQEPAAAPLKTGFVFNPNVTLSSRKLDLNDQQVGKYRAVQFDSKVGYVFDNGLFAGAQLNYTVGSVSAGGAADNDVSTYFAGPTIGATCNLTDTTSLFATATYHFLGSSTIAGLGKYESINGFQVDLGLPMTVSENLKLGPQLSIKRLNLEDGTTGLADDKIKELTPYFGLWLYF